MKQREGLFFFIATAKIPGNREQGELLLMQQNRLSAIGNMVIIKAFGTPEMFICDADKSAPSNKGTDHELEAWNRSSRQSLYISVRS